MKPRVIFILALLTFLKCGQSQNIVETEGISNSIHRDNVGKIRFMAKPIATDKVRESDYISSFNYNESTDFNIRIYLDNSLTNYLHRLDHTLAVQDLVKNGNYQFSFYVDDKLVYKENLNPGAGSAEYKNSKTSIRVPLISPSQEDSWGRFLWNRFMIMGGEDALTEGKHMLRMEARPYLKASAIKVGDVIAKGEIELIIRKPSVTESQIAIQKIFPGSGWPISTSGFDTTLIRELNKKIAQNDFKEIRSIVLIKSGKLLLEEYFNGANRETLHDTRSVGKTFASAMTGIAIQEGFIKNENQKLGEFYDLKKFNNYSPLKESVTIKSLLTMSSGFDGSDDNEDSPGNEEKMYPTNNWVKFALDLAMDTSKKMGESWDYFTAGVVLLGDILHQRVPGGLEKYADAKLFSPLGIKNYQWQYTPQKLANTAGGIRLRALDLARFGQLYQNGGIWNEKQIIPKNWIEKSLTRQLKLPGSENEYYGYLLWNTSFFINNKFYEAFFLSGNGGNKVYIFKDVPLVIVITSTAYNKPYMHRQVNKMMDRYILPAVLNNPN